MTDDLSSCTDDPFGYRDDLNDAWTDPGLGGPSRAGDLAAYRLALAQGRCRLCGIEPGSGQGGPLAPELANAAARELTRQVGEWAAEAERLSERWNCASEPAEADEWCARLLGARMDAWAAGVSIDDAFRVSGADFLGQAIDATRSAIDRFDDRLEAQTNALANVTGTRLLDNWRASLAPAVRKNTPWWLAGRIEEAAR
jgi:hypothetical protein